MRLTKLGRQSTHDLVFVKSLCSEPTAYTASDTLTDGTKYKKAVLSQGEPRDAAVNCDMYRILQRILPRFRPIAGFLLRN